MQLSGIPTVNNAQLRTNYSQSMLSCLNTWILCIAFLVRHWSDGCILQQQPFYTFYRQKCGLGWSGDLCSQIIGPTINNMHWENSDPSRDPRGDSWGRTLAILTKVAVSRHVSLCKSPPWTIFNGQINSPRLQGCCQRNDIEEAWLLGFSIGCTFPQRHVGGGGGFLFHSLFSGLP